MPCFERFAEQDAAYRAATIGIAPVRVGIEAAVRQGWDAIIGTDGIFVGMIGFGASGPYEDLYQHFGITAEAVVEAGDGAPRAEAAASGKDRETEKERLMAVRVAINGFGRIGRNILRAIVESGRNDIEVVAINDLGPVETNAHLLRYDSVHGRFPGEVKVNGDTIDVGRGPIKVTAERDPVEASAQGARRRHRAGMHRHLHRRRRRPRRI